MHTDHDPHAVNYLIESAEADPVAGRVRADASNMLWNGGMALSALLLCPIFVTPGAIAVFVVTTGAALLLGHSLGYHRMMIHGSFSCAPWLRRVFIWWGAVVGMDGPYGIIRAHDMRDWAQREPNCHPYLRHGAGMLRDAWWQIYCRLELQNPPQFDFGKLDADPFTRWIERTWRWQQLPIALAFYAIGGWPWVIWGVAARVAVATHGHWLIGHLAHNRGPQSWIVTTSGVQAYDVPWAAIPTMGEAWHNNHHAYPGSARIGLEDGQSDWGYAVLHWLERRGLVWDVQTPETLGARASLLAVTQSNAAPHTHATARHRHPLSAE